MVALVAGHHISDVERGHVGDLEQGRRARDHETKCHHYVE